MTEAETSTRIVGARPAESTSHESSPPAPNIEESAPQTEEKAKDAGEAAGAMSAQAPVPQSPQVFITFLVISGRRRTMSFEPETTLGRVKELVWNAWPSESEWEDERPLAPSYIRVLYLGKMLQDDDTLSKLKFPTHTPQSSPGPIPTIVHLSVRPYAPPGENDLKKKRARNRTSDANPQPSTGNDGEQNRGAGCCGCIVC
ncbi:ubiquitin-related domain-containing protein [Lyophyllum atratum]|nr:ubiquitin-related domain-containing protein [Lyophyllum atratum]